MVQKKLVRAECIRTNVVHALADIVATKLGINLLYFGPSRVRALADLVATKLGIILFFSSFFLFFLFPSTYFFPRSGLPTILNLCMHF